MIDPESFKIKVLSAAIGTLVLLSTIKVLNVRTPEILCNHPKILTNSPYSRKMSPKDADGVANSEDPDQGLHCLPRPIC